MNSAAISALAARQTAELEARRLAIKAPAGAEAMTAQGQAPADLDHGPQEQQAPAVPVISKADALAAKAKLLKGLAKEIKAADADAVKAMRAGLQAARIAGQKLLEAKKLVAHGGFETWRSANLPTVSERSCQVYMRIAKRFAFIEADAAAAGVEVDALSIDHADKLLRLPSPKKAGEPKGSSNPEPIVGSTETPFAVAISEKPAYAGTTVAATITPPGAKVVEVADAAIEIMEQVEDVSAWDADAKATIKNRLSVMVKQATRVLALLA